MTVNIPTVSGFGRWLLLPLLAVAFARAVCAGPAIQSLESIRTVAEAFIRTQAKGNDRVSVRIGELDRRLRLSQCSKPLRAFWPPGARTVGNTSVGVKCNGSKPWKIYVSSGIERFEHVVVAVGGLARGESLDAADLRLEERGISKLPRGYVTDLKKLIGYRTRRSLNPGDIVTLRMVAAHKLIKRGQKITLVAKLRGIDVRMVGTAMGDGTLGSIIKVRNLSSKRIIDGEVVAAGQVQVRL